MGRVELARVDAAVEERERLAEEGHGHVAQGDAEERERLAEEGHGHVVMVT